MKYLKILILLTLPLLSTAIQAQVTIGLDEAPVEGAILQLKTIDQNSLGTFNVTAQKGFGLPRVSLGTTGYAAGDNSDTRLLKSLGLTGVATDASLHTGLMIFNVTESTISGNATNTFAENTICKGVYVWMGDKWSRAMVSPCQ